MIKNAEALCEALFAYYRRDHALTAPPGIAEAVIAHRAMVDTRSALRVLSVALQAAGLCLVDRALLARVHAVLADGTDEQSQALHQALAGLLDDAPPS